MLYLSTRGDPARKHFCEILLEGLAPDGGLYLPERYPQVDAAALRQPPLLVRHFLAVRIPHPDQLRRRVRRRRRRLARPAVSVD